MRRAFSEHGAVVMLGLVLTLMGCAGSGGPPPSPLPTAVPIPGWHVLEAEALEMWLPEQWEGAVQRQDLGSVAEQVESWGPAFQELAPELGDPEAVILWAYDTQSAGESYLTQVVIHRDPWIAPMRGGLEVSRAPGRSAGVGATRAFPEIQLLGFSPL